jgi:hypothetical protein
MFITRLRAISEFHAYGGGIYGTGMRQFCREIGFQLIVV